LVIVEELTYQNTKPHDVSFWATREKFVQLWGWKYFYKRANFFKRPLIITPEIIYEDYKFVKRFRQAKVLIIGGGPSTLDNNWSASEYDIVCSSNDYYLNKKIKPLVDFCTLNRRDQPLEPFEELSCVVCFERPAKNTPKFYEQFFERSMLAYCRYNSRLGICARLIVLCTLWRAQEIHIIGIDGYPKKIKNANNAILTSHAFDKPKRIPKWYTYERYCNLYESLWYYLKNKIGKNVKYVNLGYGHNYNISSLYLDNKGNWLGPLAD